MISKERLHEACLLCRTREGLERPEFADVAEAIRHDAQLRAAVERWFDWETSFHSDLMAVPIPDQLYERLCARLAEQPDPADSIEIEPSTPVPVPRQEVPPFLRRRRWPVLASLAAMLLVTAMGWWQMQVWDQKVLCQYVEQWANQSRQSTDWQTDVGLHAGYPLPDSLGHHSPLRSRQIQTDVDPTTVIYQLTASPEVQAYCLIVRPTRRLRGIPHEPPVSAEPSPTGAWYVGMWQEQGAVIALVVNGHPDQYKQLLRHREFVRTEPPSISIPFLAACHVACRLPL